MIKSLHILLEMIIITILGAIVIIINCAILIADAIINTKQSDDDY